MCDNSKKISIVVPVYNVAPYLERCVNSILAQSYADIEIVLVDDGSTDESGELCDKLCNKDARIIVVHQENGGVTKARKKGVSTASGFYVGYVDPDDWVEPDMYEKLLEIMVEENADIVCSGMKRENDSGVYATWPGSDYDADVYRGEKLSGLKRNLISDGTIHISGSLANKLFKRELLSECLMNLDERMRGVGDDVACVFPYILRTTTVVITDDAYYHGYDRENSATRSRYENWYEQSNLLYMCLKNAIDKYDDNSDLYKGLELFWMKEVIYGMKLYYPESYSFRFPYKLGREGCHISIVLYGAGLVGKNYYRQFLKDENVEVVSWVDRAYKEIKDRDHKIYNVQTIAECEYDMVVVAIDNEKVANEIIQDLIESYDVKRQNIIWEKPVSFYKYCIEQQVLLV